MNAAGHILMRVIQVTTERTGEPAGPAYAVNDFVHACWSHTSSNQGAPAFAYSNWTLHVCSIFLGNKHVVYQRGRIFYLFDEGACTVYARGRSVRL